MTINPDGRRYSEGVPASPSGYSAEPEPSCTVSAVPVSIPNAALLASLQDIRDDIDWACTAIMKLHEQRARGRLEARLIKIDKLIDSLVVMQ